jgi:hypothetical protein
MAYDDSSPVPPIDVPDGDKAVPLPDAERTRLFMAGWPIVLIRSLEVAGDYLAGVESFGEFRFAKAIEAGNDWVTLLPSGMADDRAPVAYPFPAGVTVRVSKVMWISESPDGWPKQERRG